MPPAVGLGTVRRLAELESRDGHVLSVYLSLEPASAALCDARLRDLATRLPQPLDPATTDRVRATLRRLPALAHGTRGVAAFFSGEGAALELVPLPMRVDTIAVLDREPWLKPLAAAFSPEDRGAAVTGEHRNGGVVRMEAAACP